MSGSDVLSILSRVETWTSDFFYLPFSNVNLPCLFRTDNRNLQKQIQVKHTKIALLSKIYLQQDILL